jgi:hypothetical protein
MFYFLNWAQLRFSAQPLGPWPSAGPLPPLLLGLGLPAGSAQPSPSLSLTNARALPLRLPPLAARPRRRRRRLTCALPPLGAPPPSAPIMAEAPPPSSLPGRSPSKIVAFITIMAHHHHRPFLSNSRPPRSPSDPTKGCPNIRSSHRSSLTPPSPISTP